MSGCSMAAAECHSDQSDVEQPKEVRRNGTEPRRWTTDAEWTAYIQQYCSDRRSLPSAVSIFRVPKLLKAVTTDAYAATIVSLGPYHHGRQELLSMEDHKPRALCRMMTRLGHNKDICVLARKEIMQLDDSIRNSYEEKIDHEKEFLAAMLTLDGSFILEILRTLAHGESRVTNYYEPIFDKKKIIYTGDDILRDIMKLENQIPLIVLRKLLDLEFNSAEYVQKQLMLAVKGLLRTCYPFNFEKDINLASIIFGVSLIQDEQVHHLLGLLHTLVLSPHADNAVTGEGGGEDDAVNGQNGDNYTRLSGEESQGSTVRPVACSKLGNYWDQITKCWHQDKEMLAPWLPCAVKLRNAGIKFERCNGGIKKIKFDRKSATIYLPPINITRYTEVLFRNLIAFEMCCPSEFNYVTWYVSLMDDLIDSEEDVALLRKMGIVTAGLGTDASVADLFKSLSKGITVNPGNVAQNVHEYINNNKFKVQCAQSSQLVDVLYAHAVKEFFSSPWKTVALAGSIVLLLLTTVQTIFAILAVYK